MVATLADAWDEGDMDMLDKVLLAGSILAFCVNILTAVCALAVLDVVSAFEVALPSPCTKALPAVVRIDVLPGTVIGVTTGIGVDVLARVDASM